MWLLPDRRFESEVSEWKRTGTFPDDVIRLYQSDRTRHKDFVRMTAMGYRVTSQEKIAVGFGPSSSGKPAGVQAACCLTSKSYFVVIVAS